MNFCPVCGTKVAGAFCGTCGRQLVASPALADVAATPEPTAPPESTAPVAALWTPPPTPVAELPTGERRRQLVFETWFVMIAFLGAGGGERPPVLPVLRRSERAALSDGRAQRSGEPDPRDAGVSSRPQRRAHRAVLAVADRPGTKELGLGMPSFTRDVLPGLGIGAAAFGVEVLMLIPLAPFINAHSKLVNTVSAGHFPKYYLIEGIFMSAVTAVTEEVLVNGYLNTRLYQLGWSPRASLLLSLNTAHQLSRLLRDWLRPHDSPRLLCDEVVSKSITSSIARSSHFLYDAILFSIQILK